MRVFFVCLYILLVVLMMHFSFSVRKKNSEYTKPLCRLIGAGLATMTIYVLFLMTTVKAHFAAVLMDGLYFASVSWLIYFLMEYTLVYTRVKVYSMCTRLCVMAVLIADSASMVSNAYVHHAFDLALRYSDTFNMKYWGMVSGVPYFIHSVLCYAMFFCCLLALVVKMRQTPKFYRKKYGIFLSTILFVMAIEAVTFSLDLPVDFSVMMYAVLIISLSYFSIYAIPNMLVERTRFYVVDDMSSSMFCFDLDGRLVYANKNAKALMRSDEMVVKDVERDYKAWLSKGGHEDLEKWEQTVHISGEDRSLFIEYQLIRDESGGVIGCFFKIDDHTEELKEYAEQQYRASHDHLTGLYNRESFFITAREMIDKDPDTPRYMLCSNIKDFKFINELFGPEMGDAVLRRQTELILEFAKDGTIVGRISGDRFAMMMPKERFSEELFLDCIDKVCSMADTSIYKMHIYLGVYEITDLSEAPQAMYDKANMAIELINGDYQQTITYYDEGVSRRLHYEKAVVAEFDHAVERGQFCIFLQPQVGVDGNVLGAEALVRWKHPQRGLVYPGDFIPIIEKAGLIHRLDMCVWEQAAKKLREWKDAGDNDMHISVNISAKDFYYLNIYDVFTSLVEKYGIDPSRLKLEITESVIMSDVKNHMNILNKLQEYGFDIEIDDFGSGYSSLNSLKDIKADVLKIDMLFLRETENQTRSRTILNSIISMAKALNMPVITEGVENQVQVDYLREMGCDMFQGYFFSKPIDVIQFEELYLNKDKIS